jgi:hypothetical protein
MNKNTTSTDTKINFAPLSHTINFSITAANTQTIGNHKCGKFRWTQTYSQASWPLRQTQIVVCCLIPKTDTLPATPPLSLNRYQIFTSRVVRVQDQKFQVTSISIEVHTKNSMSQDTTPCKPISHTVRQKLLDRDHGECGQALQIETNTTQELS